MLVDIWTRRKKSTDFSGLVLSPCFPELSKVLQLGGFEQALGPDGLWRSCSNLNLYNSSNIGHFESQLALLLGSLFAQQWWDLRGVV